MPVYIYLISSGNPNTLILWLSPVQMFILFIPTPHLDSTGRFSFVTALIYAYTYIYMYIYMYIYIYIYLCMAAKKRQNGRLRRGNAQRGDQHQHVSGGANVGIVAQKDRAGFFRARIWQAVAGFPHQMACRHCYWVDESYRSLASHCRHCQ